MRKFKRKSATKTIALLLAILTVFSMLPVAAMASSSENSTSGIALGILPMAVMAASSEDSTPSIVLDDNNSLASGRKKVPAKAGSSSGVDIMSPIYTGGNVNPVPGGWAKSEAYFVRYTLARIDGANDVLENSVNGSESLMFSRWSDLVDAAINNTDWFISVNAGTNGNPSPFTTMSGFPGYATTTNALGYEQVLRNNGGTFESARQALNDYLFGTADDGHIQVNPSLHNYFRENGSNGMPSFNTVSTGTSGMQKLFAGDNATRLVDGAHVLDASDARSETVGDKLLAFFYDKADISKKQQMREDAAQNLTNQGKTDDEIDETMSKATPAEIANLAFTCTGSGFCYRVIAEPGRVCTRSSGTEEEWVAYTFRDFITIAYLEATRADSPRTPHDSSGVSALCTSIANTGIAMTPTKNEFLLAHFDNDGKIDVVYDYADGTAASPFPKERGKSSIEGSAVETGRAIYDEVIGANSFKGYGVGVWAGFQQGSVPGFNTTISVRKTVSSLFPEYTDTVSFGMDITISGFEGTPKSLMGTVYNGDAQVRSYTGDFSGGILSFSGVNMKDNYVFKLADDALEAQEESRIKVVVTETGETDGKFNYLFPACATYMTVPQGTIDCTSSRSGTFEFTGKNGININVINTLKGVSIEKTVDDSILNDPDLDKWDENYPWPFYVGFNINDEPYSGTAYCVKFDGDGTIVETRTETIGKGIQFLFTLRHKEIMYIASAEFVKANAQGKWMYYGVGEQDVPEFRETLEARGRSWITTFSTDYTEPEEE